MFCLVKFLPALYYVVSTALWTGVYLADVLDYVKPIRPQAKHVIFEGADDLPKGPYGTSQKLSWALNKEKGMMIGTSLIIHPLKPDVIAVFGCGSEYLLLYTNIDVSSVGYEWFGTGARPRVSRTVDSTWSDWR